jgi:ATP-dependent Zn protease
MRFKRHLWTRATKVYQLTRFSIVTADTMATYRLSSVDSGPGKSDVCNEASSVHATTSSTVSTSSLSQTSGTTFSTTTQSTTASSTETSATSTLTSVEKESVPVGAIAGGVVGGVVGLALIGLGLFLFLRRSRQAQKSLDENTLAQKSTQEVLLKHYNGPHTIPQDGTVLEALGDVASPRYELSGAPVNSTGTRHELS